MITYTDDIGTVSHEQLDGFFVGWEKHPSPEQHLDILKGSDKVVLAIDDEREKVVGFIAAITDGVLSAYIPLLEVLPQYQKQGTGKELAARMLEKLKDFYMIDLVCDPEMQEFYENLGMQKTTAMMLRNYNKREGK